MTYVSVTVCDTYHVDVRADRATSTRRRATRGARGVSATGAELGGAVPLGCGDGFLVCVVCRVSGLIYLAAYRCGLATALHGHPTAVRARAQTGRRQTAGPVDQEFVKRRFNWGTEGSRIAQSETGREWECGRSG
jgi:hypothetical protein